MALFNKVGSILKQSISQSSSMTMLNSARYMSTKLFVGGLSYSTDDGSLKQAFEEHGEVVEAKVIMDRDTGRSRGFGFVSFTEQASADEAVKKLDGQDLHGRTIRVSIANERPPRPAYGGGGGGYGGGGGGYGGGGGGYGGGGGAYGAGGGDGGY